MRFEPRKRTAIDGKVWWCAYDTKKKRWSSFLCHAKHKTRKAMMLQIEMMNKYIQ